MLSRLAKDAIQTTWRRLGEKEPRSLLRLQLKASMGIGVEIHYTSAFQQPTPTLLGISCYSQVPVTKYSSCLSDWQESSRCVHPELNLHTLLIWLALQPISPWAQKGSSAAFTGFLRLTLSWKTGWKTDHWELQILWLQIIMQKIDMIWKPGSSLLSKYKYLWIVSIRWRKQGKRNCLNPMGDWYETGKEK